MDDVDIDLQASEKIFKKKVKWISILILTILIGATISLLDKYSDK